MKRKLIDTVQLGKNLRKQQYKMNTTQRAVALMADIDEVEYGRYLRGTQKPSLASVYKLSHVYGCPMEELLKGCVLDGEGGLWDE